MRRETIEIIEFLEANAHLDFWTAMKEFYGFTKLTAYRKEEKEDL